MFFIFFPTNLSFCDSFQKFTGPFVVPLSPFLSNTALNLSFGYIFYYCWVKTLLLYQLNLLFSLSADSSMLWSKFARYLNVFPLAWDYRAFEIPDDVLC
jgi:hypothetical protein